MKNNTRTTRQQLTDAIKTTAIISPFIMILGCMLACFPIVVTGIFLMLAAFTIDAFTA
jgi:Zn-dependent membrane protease YugP